MKPLPAAVIELLAGRGIWVKQFPHDIGIDLEYRTYQDWIEDGQVVIYVHNEDRGGYMVIANEMIEDAHPGMLVAMIVQLFEGND